MKASKTVTLGAALIGFSLFGAGTALAQPPQPNCDTHGENTTHCQRAGDNEIVVTQTPINVPQPNYHD